MKDFRHFTGLTIIIFSIFIFSQFSFATQAPPVGQSKVESAAIPGGQSKGTPASEDGVTADIFGKKGGRFHPFVMIEEIYTDNFFATNTDPKEEFTTNIAPGIWLAFPANRAKLLNIDTTTTSPGGLQLSRVKPEATRRYQSYFLYSPEFVLYSNNSKKNHTNQRAEALYQYNLNSGLSFDFIDLFNDKEEIAGNGVFDTLYHYQDNLFDFITAYDSPSGKYKFQFTYSNYNLGYDDTDVAYRDRNDNSFGVSAFYRFWPKTSLFLEYNYSDIKSRENYGVFVKLNKKFSNLVVIDLFLRQEYSDDKFLPII
ncbi:MAG: hypothetical protein L3J69_15855, partial [Desulfobacula sp.]|nr:hypothetical protein [Desulfobacula sp.]